MHWLDPLVPLSFGAPGYRLHARHFDPLPDATGRRVAVTGANAGLGRAMVDQLVGAGADVIAICRDRARAERALAGLKKVRIELADMSDLTAVRALAERLPELDALVHNAGALLDTQTHTAEGLEVTTACHVAGPHVLTSRLRHRVSRVVYVSSGGMFPVRLSLTRLRQPQEPFDGVTQYALAKRAQATLPALYRRHWGATPRVEVMHPGWADTGGVRSSLPTFHSLTKRLLRTPHQGADTATWLALAELPDWQEGIWLDRRRHGLAPVPGTRPSVEQATALWVWLETFAA